MSGHLDVTNYSKLERQHLVMSVALGAILRDGLDPKEVHKTMWRLKDFREAVPTDVPDPEGKPPREGGEELVW